MILSRGNLHQIRRLAIPKFDYPPGIEYCIESDISKIVVTGQKRLNFERTVQCH